MTSGIIECAKCGDEVAPHDKHAAFEGSLWHRDCFQCDECSCHLENILFGVSPQQELLCQQCYDVRFSVECIHCGEQVKLGDEKFVLGELCWHRGCFQCKNCEEILNPNSFWIHGDLYYCKSCYGDLCTERCGNCNEMIMKDGIEHRDQHFHSSCFNCASCSVNLIDKRFFFRDDLVYCQDCLIKRFSKTCLRCNEFIKGFDGDKMMTSGDQHWHETCFVCNDCQESLVGLSFVSNAGKILCPGCAKAK